MTQTTEQQASRWYADKGEDAGVFAGVYAQMRELEAWDVLDGDEPVWEAFVAFVRSTALSQEVCGEYLSEQAPEALGPMWMSFRAGWSGGAGQYANG